MSHAIHVAHILLVRVHLLGGKRLLLLLLLPPLLRRACFGQISSPALPVLRLAKFASLRRRASSLRSLRLSSSTLASSADWYVCQTTSSSKRRAENGPSSSRRPHPTGMGTSWLRFDRLVVGEKSSGLVISAPLSAGVCVRETAGCPRMEF